MKKSHIRTVKTMILKIIIHLDIRNGTYGPLGFISGVEIENPSSSCQGIMSSENPALLLYVKKPGFMI